MLLCHPQVPPLGSRFGTKYWLFGQRLGRQHGGGTLREKEEWGKEGPVSLVPVKSRSPGECEQQSPGLTTRPLKQALPGTPPHLASRDLAPMLDSPGGLGSTPRADFSLHTRPPWGALPAEPGEIMHGLGEGGDRRGGGRALREPQEARSSQPEAREVAWALGASAHAGRT